MKKWTIEWAMKKYGVIMSIERAHAYILGKKTIACDPGSPMFAAYLDGALQRGIMTEEDAVRWLVDGAERRKKWENVGGYKYTNTQSQFSDLRENEKIVIKKVDGVFRFTKYWKRSEDQRVTS